VLRCQGLVDDDDPAMLLAAVQKYRQLPQTFELALACEDTGAALQRAGRAGEAVPVLEDALGFYLRVGAQRAAARVEAALRGLGVRRRRTGRARRPSTGWESLTDSELGIIRLAAEGLTYRQIGDRLFIPAGQSETTWPTCSRNWASTTAPSWPPRSPAAKDSDKHPCGTPGRRPTATNIQVTVDARTATNR
jgi:hypothetical protein